MRDRIAGPVRLGSGLAALALAAGMGPAHAEDLDVANYPNASNAWAIEVAMARGFFDKAGAHVTGIVATNGGGGDIRNMVAGDLPLAIGGIGSAIAAYQQNVDVKLICQELNNATTVSWVVPPDSPIKDIRKDLKGKKIGYSTPQSTTQGYETWMVQKLGYMPGEVTLVAAGGFPQSLTLLEHGALDVSIITEPVATQQADKYRTIARGTDASIFPAINSGVCMTSSRAMHDKPDEIRRIIQGRRLAVEYMNKNREDLAAIIAKATSIDAGVTLKVLNRILDEGTVDGVPTIELGNFYPKALDNAVTFARLVGSVQGDVDLSKLVDDSFLPDDLRGMGK